jgi:hypothetical protein
MGECENVCAYLESYAASNMLFEVMIDFKEMFTLGQAMKAQRRSRCIALHFP